MTSKNFLLSESYDRPHPLLYFGGEVKSLLPPKLQRRGLVFERKLVTVECVMGYYGTCDGLLWDVYAGYYDSA